MKSPNFVPAGGMATVSDPQAGVPTVDDCPALLNASRRPETGSATIKLLPKEPFPSNARPVGCAPSTSVAKTLTAPLGLIRLICPLGKIDMYANSPKGPPALKAKPSASKSNWPRPQSLHNVDTVPLELMRKIVPRDPMAKTSPPNPVAR